MSIRKYSNISIMEELPTPLIVNIISHLSRKDIHALSQTNKHMHRILHKEVFYKDVACKRFHIGPWSGTWTNDTIQFTGDPIIDKIYCKSILFRNVDHSNETYYKLYATLKQDYESCTDLYYHPYFKDLHQWLADFFRIPRTVIRFLTYVPIHLPLKYYNVPSNYRKRDHCSLIGITLCFHQCEDLRWKNTNFSQRLGLNHNRDMNVNIWDKSSHPDKIKLHITSEVMIHPHYRWSSDNKLVDHNSTKTHTTIHFTLTSTECIAKTSIPTEYESMKEYQDTLEVCCNAMYSVIKNKTYENILEDVKDKIEDLALKMRRPASDIVLDIPKNEEHIWELIQSMKVYQYYYPPSNSTSTTTNE